MNDMTGAEILKLVLAMFFAFVVGAMGGCVVVGRNPIGTAKNLLRKLKAGK